MIIQSVLIYLHWIIVFLITGFLYLYVSVKNIDWIQSTDEIDKKYDYIIGKASYFINYTCQLKNLIFHFVSVGGGSAGAIVASRLTEDPNISVLLLEAGVEKWNLLNIPALGPFHQLTGFDWQYETVPQKHACYGLKNNVRFLSRFRLFMFEKRWMETE